MNRILIGVLLLATSLFLVSCEKKQSAWVEDLIIASQRPVVENGGKYPPTYYAKKSEAASWELFYAQVTGLVYEQGYEYILQVKVEDVRRAESGAPQYAYTVLRVLSKRARQSQGFPDHKAE